MGAGERGFVPGLGPIALEHLEQRRFLAADVSPWADEEAEVERDPGAQDVRADQTLPVAPLQLAPEHLGLRLVLVTDVDDARASPDDEAGQDHGLDQEMGDLLHEKAVLDRSRLALVCVADDVLPVGRRVSHDLPLGSRGEAGASESSQLARLELSEQTRDVRIRDEGAERPVALAALVRVDREALRRPGHLWVGQAPLREGGPDVAGQGVRGQPCQDDVVERGRGCPVALSQTG